MKRINLYLCTRFYSEELVEGLEKEILFRPEEDERGKRKEPEKIISIFFG
jgi:hypothetical protein